MCKKKLFMLFFIMYLLLCFTCNVNADTIDKVTCNGARYNTEDVCGSVKSDDSCGNASKTVSDPIPPITETPVEVCSEGIKYRVVILVDNSYSMNRTRTGSADYKVDATNKAIKKIIRMFNSKSPGSKINVCLFLGSDHCSGFEDVDKLTDDINASRLASEFKLQKSELSTGSTYTQLQLSRAYEKLVNKNWSNGFAPYVILITDGYPTTISKNANVSLGTSAFSGSSNIQGGISNTSNALYFYKTILSLRSLKNNMKNNLNPNAKLGTVALMNKDDSLVKFFLNPNSTTYNNLGSGDGSLISGGGTSEASYLKTAIANRYTNVVEATAGIESYPDLGLYHGNTGETNNGKNKITYEVGITDSYRKFMTNKYCYDDKKCGLRFFFKGSTNNVTEVRVYYPNSSGEFKSYKKFTSGFANMNTKGTTRYSYFEITDSTVCNNNKKCIDFDKLKVVIIFSSNFKDDFCTTSVNMQSSSLLTSFIDFYIASDDSSSEIESSLESGITGSICKTETRYVAGSTSNNSTENDSNCYNCITYSYNPSVTYYYKQNNVVYTLSDYKLEYYVKETLDYKFGTLKSASDGGGKVYSGGGIDWKDTSVSNSITWDYVNKVNSVPAFSDVTLMKDGKCVLKSGSTSQCAKISFIPLNQICTNSSCTSTLNSSSFKDDINGKVENNKKDNTSRLQTAFKTIDSNATDNFNSAKVDVNHDVKLEGNYNYKLSLRGAYVKAGKNGEYEYISKESYDSSDPSFRGNYWYIPLKYPSGNFPIYVNGNFSSFNGIDFNLLGTCSIEVVQQLYKDPPGGSGEPAKGLEYRYRSIDVSDPFPMGSIPYNWKEWYNIESNKKRLEDSTVNSPLYTVTFDKSDSSNISDGSSSESYVSWQNITNNGSSNLLSNWKNKGFLQVSSSSTKSYCPKGEFYSECDAGR